MSANDRIELTVAGESLRLRAQKSEQDRLRRAAQYLDEKMEAFKETGAVASSHRLTILAALDIAHELFIEREKGTAPGKPQAPSASADDAPELNERIDELIEQVDEALETTPKEEA